jgi:hypothetical protein
MKDSTVIKRLINSGEHKFPESGPSGNPMVSSGAGCGGGGGIAPGLPMFPARAGTVSTTVRNVVARVVFILLISVS